MSAPRRKRTRLQKRPGLTRRTFLKGLGFGGAALTGMSALQGCGSSSTGSSVQAQGNDPTQKTQEVSFLHSVASGDPLADAVILWTRVTPADSASSSVKGRVEVYSNEALTALVRTIDFETTPAKDFTVKIDCTGLQADTFYFYRFLSNGALSPVGRTKTMPVAKRPVNLGLVSCSSMAHGFFNAYSLLADRDDLEAIVHLGDYIYEYGNGQYGSLREYDPPNEITTLSDYRRRHAHYKKDEDLQKLHLRYPFITIWDDHESTDNSYTDGANNHNEGEGVWEERKGWSQQAYDEWMPIRLPEPGNPNKIFRKIPLGGMGDLILLDTRLYDRDAELSLPINPVTENAADPARTMIGQEQYDFLISNLRSSTANWKLIGNQVVFHQWIIKPGANNPAPAPLQNILAPSGLNGDSWDAFAAERQKIINALRGVDGGSVVNDAIFLTGDVHSAWVADITDDPNNPLAYNPLTGEGSVATEFVVTSVTSPGLPLPDEFVQAIRVSSPHIKHVKMSERGYSILRLTETEATCEYWAVSTIEQRGATEALSTRFAVQKGQNRIAAADNPLSALPLPLP